MRRRHAVVLAAALVAGGGAVAATSHTPHHSRVIPLHALTPGAVNPKVTQANIDTTICVPGWTATVRPPVNVTSRIKAERMRAYGYHDTPAKYELDHLIPLELAGAPASPANLWPEPYAGKQGARVKDSLENRLRSEVCDGAITLKEAQHRIAGDWTHA